jgi:hypothetical protein
MPAPASSGQRPLTRTGGTRPHKLMIGAHNPWFDAASRSPPLPKAVRGVAAKLSTPSLGSPFPARSLPPLRCSPHLQSPGRAYLARPARSVHMLLPAWFSRDSPWLPIPRFFCAASRTGPRTNHEDLGSGARPEHGTWNGVCVHARLRCQSKSGVLRRPARTEANS